MKQRKAIEKTKQKQRKPFYSYNFTSQSSLLARQIRNVIFIASIFKTYGNIFLAVENFSQHKKVNVYLVNQNPKKEPQQVRGII